MTRIGCAGRRTGLVLRPTPAPVGCNWRREGHSRSPHVRPFVEETGSMPNRLHVFAVSCLVAILALIGWRTLPVALADEASAQAAAPVDYARDVKPILAAHCYDCHGASKRKGGLRLDSKLDVFQGGDRGESPIKPGDAKKSHLMELVRGDDPDLYMPPKGKRLTKDEIDVLTRWIDQGANSTDAGPVEFSKPTHWSFQKPVRPE